MAVLAAMIISVQPVQSQDESVEGLEQIRKMLGQMRRQTGTIELPSGVARLELGDDYYFLDPSDTQTVLVDLWGNMPSNEPLEGMVFPAGVSPLDDEAWAFTISYIEEGHVDVKDAASINYTDLLNSMKADAEAANEWRMQSGYEPVRLIGWASDPYYDSANHKLHWAKELRFGEDQDHVLNYNIRMLGRRGVLEFNFIAGINQLDQIESRLPSVLQLASFTDGNRYSDFDPSIDKIAAYGIGGLIAGKVMAKTGLFVKLLLVFKKFWLLLIVGAGAIVKRFTGRKAAT
jgi:uncharacterized membrane-anchored protein